jgi:hypothetical protein
MRTGKKALKNKKPAPGGFGLIMVVIILAFLSSLGLVMMSLTGTGSQVSGNIRTQEQAFNAAEAGFDAAWALIQDSFIDGLWASFSEHYVTEPAGIDIPTDALYFRNLTDLEILSYFDPNGDGNPDVGNVLFFRQPYILDSQGQYDLRYTYTVFLINDEAAGAPYDEKDVMLVTIGAVGIGSDISTSRIEVELEKN